MGQRTSKTRPLNLRQQRFADQVILTGKITASYVKVYGDRGTATKNRDNASKVWRAKNVRAYCDAALQKESEDTVLTRAEKRAFLKRVVETPLSEVDASSPLAAEIATVEGPYGTSVKVKKYSALQAIAEDNKMSGDLIADAAASTAAHALADMVAAIRIDKS